MIREDENEDQKQHIVNKPMKKQTREKYSVGIACIRIVNKIPEILLICKRYTYGYNMFVHGRYNSGDTGKIIAMFNGMTVEEKHDILSLNFSQIWYRIWLNSKHRLGAYFAAKNKFESTFAVDGGLRLRRMIIKSTNSGATWNTYPYLDNLGNPIPLSWFYDMHFFDANNASPGLPISVR